MVNIIVCIHTFYCTTRDAKSKHLICTQSMHDKVRTLVVSKKGFSELNECGRDGCFLYNFSLSLNSFLYRVLS